MFAKSCKYLNVMICKFLHLLLNGAFCGDLKKNHSLKNHLLKKHSLKFHSSVAGFYFCFFLENSQKGIPSVHFRSIIEALLQTLGSSFLFERLKISTGQAVGVVANNQAIVGSILVAWYSSLVAYLISISLAGSEKKQL